MLLCPRGAIGVTKYYKHFFCNDDHTKPNVVSELTALQLSGAFQLGTGEQDIWFGRPTGPVQELLYVPPPTDPEVEM
jgi:hypothetical protein